jgi:hypothetical protein
MPIEYILLVINSDHKEGNHEKILTSRVSKLDELHENRLQFKVKLGTQ